MIQDPSKDLTLIVYNAPKPPRYLKINKKLLRLLLFLVPFLLIIALLTSLASSVYMKKNSRPRAHRSLKLFSV